jgi:ABC-type transporter MlaC component
MGQVWKSLSYEDKQHYEDQYTRSRAEYDIKLREYHEQKRKLNLEKT